MHPPRLSLILANAIQTHGNTSSATKLEAIPDLQTLQISLARTLLCDGDHKVVDSSQMDEHTGHFRRVGLLASSSADDCLITFKSKSSKGTREVESRSVPADADDHQARGSKVKVSASTPPSQHCERAGESISSKTAQKGQCDILDSVGGNISHSQASGDQSHRPNTHSASHVDLVLSELLSQSYLSRREATSTNVTLGCSTNRYRPADMPKHVALATELDQDAQ